MSHWPTNRQKYPKKISIRQKYYYKFDFIFILFFFLKKGKT
jgi:hypothetical protein